VDPEDDGHDLAGRGGEQQQQRDCRQLLALLLRGGGSRRPKRKLSGGARSQHGQARHAGREEDPGGTQPIGQQQSCDDEAVEGIQTVVASANTPNASVNAANKMEGKVAQKKNANKRSVAKSLPLISHFVRTLSSQMLPVLSITCAKTTRRGISHAHPPQVLQNLRPCGWMPQDCDGNLRETCFPSCCPTSQTRST
jgi:hypothetical protein